MKDFNTKEGITAQLGSYENLFDLLCKRSHTREPLTPFVILGRFLSDEKGNFGILNPELFTDADRAAMSPVMEYGEFQRFIEPIQSDPRRRSFRILYPDCDNSYNEISSFLPPPHVLCVECKEGWDIQSCHLIVSTDTYHSKQHERFDLSDFVGKTLFEVAKELPKGMTDPSKTTHFYNRFIWSKPSQEGRHVKMHYRVQSGDEMSVFYRYFYHASCVEKMIEKTAFVGNAGEKKFERELRHITGRGGIDPVSFDGHGVSG